MLDHMGPRRRVEVGTVFSVRIDETSRGYGQVVEVIQPGAFLVVMFDRLDDALAPVPDPVDVATASVILAALSFDALLWHGHWDVVGLATPRRPPGEFLLSTTPGQFVVVDWGGRELRAAQPDDARQLRFRSFIAPIRLERALQAWFGRGQWRDEFDELVLNRIE
jgi:hypothetical protein